MATDSINLLLKPAKYKMTQTASGCWREFLYENGRSYREYRSHREIWGRPLVSIANGRNPETGRMAVADGIIAIGQYSRGWLALGQFASGHLAIGQFAVGRVVAIGQFAVAPLALGQMSLGVLAAGQIGIGLTGIFQAGVTFVGGIGHSVYEIGQHLRVDSLIQQIFGG